MADGNFEPLHAADALAAMRASRAKVLKDACPPWRHAVFSAVLSGTVAAQALPIPLFYGLMGVAFVSMIVFALVMRARKGLFINGWRKGATRRVSLAIFVSYMAVYSVTWWFRVEHGMWAPPLGGAVVLFPILWWLSRRWRETFRAELAA